MVRRGPWPTRLPYTRSGNQIRAAFTVEGVSKIVGLQQKSINNFVEKELIADFSGKLFSINNCVEIDVIEKVGRAGATLKLGMLAAAPALLRVQQRLSQRTLGTQNRLLVMVYHFDRMRSRGRGYAEGLTSISPSFCTPVEVSDVVAARMNDHDGVVQQVFGVDAAIETIVSKL